MSSQPIEKTVYLSQLFDYYKNQLTEKQRLYFELYFIEDYTLQEIADQYGISRAAVLDSLDKTAEILTRTETNLGMYQQNNKLREHLAAFKKGEIDVETLINQIEKDLI